MQDYVVNRPEEGAMNRILTASGTSAATARTAHSQDLASLRVSRGCTYLFIFASESPPPASTRGAGWRRKADYPAKIRHAICRPERRMGLVRQAGSG